MKKTGKIMLAALFFAAFAALNLSAEVFPAAKAAETFTDGNFTYKVTDGAATITGFSSYYEGDVTVPEALGGYTVKTIGEHAFAGCSEITAVHLPETVTLIDNYAFADCIGLVSFVVPDSVETICQYAFYGSSGIETLHLGAGYKNSLKPSETATDYSLSFKGMTGLKSFSVSESNSSFFAIDGVLFRGSPAATFSFLVQYPSAKEDEIYNIPDEVYDISGYAFFDVPALKAINKDKKKSVIYSVDGVLYDYGGNIIKYPQAKPDRFYYAHAQNIGNYAFYKAKNLEGIYFFNIKGVGKSAFEDCTSLYNIFNDIGAKFGSHSLKNTAIEVLTLYSDGVYFEDCFSDMPNLETVYFQQNYTKSITLSAFNNCPNLTEIFINNKDAVINDGCLPVFEDNSRLFIYSANESVKAMCEKYGYTFCNLAEIEPEYTFENGVLTINGEGAMKEMKRNKYPWNEYKDITRKIVIGDGITKVSSYAFTDFSETEVVLGKKVYDIDFGAFSSNSNLTNIVFNEHLLYLRSSAFGSNRSLTEVTLPHSVFSMYGSFSNCKNLSKVDISQCRLRSTSDCPFYGCAVNSIVLPNTIAIFTLNYTWNNITEITLGSRVLDYWAYSDDEPEYPTISAASIEKVNISSDNPTLTVVDGDIVSKDGKNYYSILPTKQVTSITLDPRTEFVSPDAFSACKTLTDIYIDDSSTALKSIDGVLYDGEGRLLFYLPARTQESYDMPDFATEISANAFTQHAYLKEITIGKNVTTIGKYAFSVAKALTICNISGSSVKRIEECAFLSSGLKSIEFPKTLEWINFSAFEKTPIEEVTIPDNVTFSTSIFNNCTNLKKVKIGKGISLLNRYSFYKCTSLTEIHIPSDITEIGDYALPTLDDNSALTVYSEINSAAHKYAVDNGYSFAEEGSYGIKHSVENGILTLSGTGDTLDFSDAKYTPWASHAEEIVSVIITDGITRIGTNALGGMPMLRYVVFDANGTVAVSDSAFANDDMLSNVALLSPAWFTENSFLNACLDCEVINLTECDGAEHTGTLPGNVAVHFVSYNNGELYISDRFVSNAYDILDTVTVYAGKYGEINTLSFDEFSAEDFTFFFYDKNGRRRTVDDNTLIGCKFGVEIADGDKRVRVSFNELSNMIAAGDTDRFSLVVLEAENVDFGVADTDIKVDDGNKKDSFILRVMKWFVTMLNNLFAFFSKFFGKK